MIQAPRSVLVAVDFGDASAKAVAVGGAIATLFGATLRLLHAETFEAPAYFTSDQLNALEGQRQAMRAQAERFLSDFGRRHTTAPLSSLVDDRPPVDAILHASSTADVVVMGTHGRRGVSRWWLGSVAERVVREITRPLLVVRADMAQPVDSMFSRVLVHAAAPSAGDDAADVGRMLAARAGGEVCDRRRDPVDTAIAESRSTLLVEAVPHPWTSSWLGNDGEPLLRFCTVPILFVPEIKGRVSI